MDIEAEVLEIVEGFKTAKEDDRLDRLYERMNAIRDLGNMAGYAACREASLDCADRRKAAAGEWYMPWRERVVALRDAERARLARVAAEQAKEHGA